MLRYEIRVPEGVQDGAPLLVLLHGRGSHKGDLTGLHPYLMPEAILVTPEAPFPGSPWGYGPGWAWYRHLGGNRPEPHSFASSQAQLHAFLTDLPSLLPVKPGPLILGGFSQGGTMSLAYALRNPGAIPFVINFSGFLADHPSVQVNAERVRGTSIFWGHGIEDPAVPFALAADGRRRLQQAGADLAVGDYPMGHWIEETELADARAWLQQAGGRPG